MKLYRFQGGFGSISMFHFPAFLQDVPTKNKWGESLY
jgi:hypothetical protein